MTSTHGIELDAPDNEIPISLAVNLVLGRGPDVAILLPSVDVYTTGIQLQVQVKMRQGVDSLSQHPIEAMSGRLGPADEAHQPSRLMLGVEFADGQRAIASRYYSGVTHQRLRDEPLTPSLTVGGGLGGPLRALVQYWVRPLPDGPMRLLCSWADAHVAETTTTIGGGEIADAARRVVVLWPR